MCAEHFSIQHRHRDSTLYILYNPLIIQFDQTSSASTPIIPCLDNPCSTSSSWAPIFSFNALLGAISKLQTRYTKSKNFRSDLRSQPKSIKTIVSSLHPTKFHIQDLGTKTLTIYFTVPKIRPQNRKIDMLEQSDASLDPEILATFSIAATEFTFFRYPQMPEDPYISINRVPSDGSNIERQLKGLGFSSENLYSPFMELLQRVEHHTSLKGDPSKISPAK